MGTAKNRVQTNSKFRVWWLQRLNGYAVKKVTQRPRLGLFGRVKYEEVFTLGLPGEDDPPSSIGFSG